MLPGGDAVESSVEPARQRGHPRGQPDHQRAGGPGQQQHHRQHHLLSQFISTADREGGGNEVCILPLCQRGKTC